MAAVDQHHRTSSAQQQRRKVVSALPASLCLSESVLQRPTMMTSPHQEGIMNAYHHYLHFFTHHILHILALDTSFYPNQGGVSSSSSTLLAYAESQANRYRGIGPLDQVYE